MSQQLATITTSLETKANQRLQQHSDALKAEFTGVFTAAQEKTEEQFKQMKIGQEKLGAYVKNAETGINQLAALLANSQEQQNQLCEMVMMTQQNMLQMQTNATQPAPQQTDSTPAPGESPPQTQPQQ
eukprot:1811821-Rhodomonas_salina.1